MRPREAAATRTTTGPARRSSFVFVPLLAAVLAVVMVFAVRAQAGSELKPPESAKKNLVVGTHPIAPFVMKNADGSWSGISIDIWKRVAEELHLTYTIREYPVAELLKPDETGIDVVVSVNASSKNEEFMDVTHGFYSTGLAIAARTEPKSGLSTIASKIFSLKFLKGVGVLLLVLIAMGTIVWRVERAKKPEEFGGSALRGIALGMFWTFESLVGKGAALSRNVTNRFIGLIWAAVCVLGISGVTASLSSELTVNKLSSSVAGPNDLPRVKVGTVKRPSSGASYLEGRGISFTPYDDVTQAAQGLARGDVDAVVFEAPILQYEISKLAPGKVAMLPGTFWNHSYGFGLRSGSDLRESLDRTILRLDERDEYKKIFARYLGTPGD